MTDEKKPADNPLEELFRLLDESFAACSDKAIAKHPSVTTASELAVMIEVTLAAARSKHDECVQAAQAENLVSVLRNETMFHAMMTLLQSASLFLAHNPQLGDESMAPRQFHEAVATAYREAKRPSELWTIKEVAR